MGRMPEDEARAEFDRLRERFERELREKTEDLIRRCEPPSQTEEGRAKAQTSADMREDDGFWETEIRRG